MNPLECGKKQPAEITAYVDFCRGKLVGLSIAICYAHRRERMTLIMLKAAQLLAHRNVGLAYPVIFDHAFLPRGQVLPGWSDWARERRK